MRLREVEEAAYNHLRQAGQTPDILVQSGIGLAILALAKAIDRWAQAKEKELESKEWSTHKSG